jgi:lipopolysaccharide biosynthesis regulator YciM
VTELLFLLLPVAAASGWWLARHDRPRERRQTAGAAPAFLRGFNYLLDEQPDKAIDVFLELAEVDNDTVETHLALASLFRRRGEVDRAIRIHQNLIARDTLSREQRGLALFELGQDYLRAGLLDRAELLFQEVVDLGMHRERALTGLRDIYQQERDWRKCLEVVERLKPFTDRPVGNEIAQYHCELAEEARGAKDSATARRHLERAVQADPNCVRASMLAGRMALAAGDREGAIERFLRVAEQGPGFVPEILPELVTALESLGRDPIPVLRGLLARHPSPPLALALASAVEREQGREAALEALSAHLSGHADLAALDRLFALAPECAADGGQRQQVVRDVVHGLLQRQPAYRCEHCGFEARGLHWQCPSCRRWGTVQPVLPERLIRHRPPEGPLVAAPGGHAITDPGTGIET